MDEHVMLDPVRRRSWLFAKASETAPLSEALALARAAESFITGTVEYSFEVTSAPIFEMLPKTEKPQQETAPTFAAPNDQPLATTEALAGLSSLVSIDDVIRYLRQGGDVVLAETETTDELLARANLKRTEQGLPPFVLFPVSPSKTAQQGKGDQSKSATAPRPPAAPRTPNRRERAATAKQLIAFSAESGLPVATKFL
jgi:hypothetical protein